MATAPFDTLRIAQALKAAGFDDEKSEAIVDAIQQSLGGELATKSDLAEFTTKSDLAELRADIYRALWIQGAGFVMITTAIVGVAVAVVAAIS